ncbi:hypothetical protein EDB80DRAFT_784472 [Ilyonectria destructans]|nr:hypothetical protein EDB80DRAFT_784472 [Ilyonectria destructans]
MFKAVHVLFFLDMSCAHALASGRGLFSSHPDPSSATLSEVGKAIREGGGFLAESFNNALYDSLPLELTLQAIFGTTATMTAPSHPLSDIPFRSAIPNPLAACVLQANPPEVTTPPNHVAPLDTGSVPRLKRSVYQDRPLQDAICALAKRIVAGLFYFELDAVPSQRGPQFRGSGSIRCLRPCADEALSALVQKLLQSSAAFRLNGSRVPGTLSGASFWTSCGNFRKKIKFTSGDATISITLQQGSPEYPISGSPFRLSELVEAQQLNANFGRSDHRERGRRD